MTKSKTAAQVCPHIATETDDFSERYEEIVAQSFVKAQLAWDETHDRCFILGYEELVVAARNWRTFSSASGVVSEISPKLLPMEADPPFHRDLRIMLNPFFTAAAISAIEPAVRTVAENLIDTFVDAGRAEVVEQYSRPYPGMVFFSEIMHLPEDDLEELQGLAEVAITPGDPGRQMEGYAGVGQYVADLVDRQSASGNAAGGDLIGTIVSAKVGGRAISREEAISVITMLIFGGLETTASTLGLALNHLAQNPEHQDDLRKNPQLLPVAVEELLRLYGPTIQLNRLTMEDTQIGEVPIPKGARVALSFSSANRDPSEFSDPNEFDLNRPSYRHVAFGIGVHRCLGSHLARSMLMIGVANILDRLGTFEVAPGFVPRCATTGVRSLEALEIVFGPAVATS